MHHTSPSDSSDFFPRSLLDLLPRNETAAEERAHFRAPPLETLLENFDPRTVVADVLALGAEAGKRLLR